jgi:hypothetical protein
MFHERHLGLMNGIYLAFQLAGVSGQVLALLTHVNLTIVELFWAGCCWLCCCVSGVALGVVVVCDTPGGRYLCHGVCT